MGRRNTANQAATSSLAPAPAIGPQFPAADPTPPIWYQAAWRWASIVRSAIPARVRIELTLLDLRVILAIESAEHENEAEIDEEGEVGEPVDAEPVNVLEADILVMGGGLAAPAPLMGSLHGILGHNAV